MPPTDHDNHEHRITKVEAAVADLQGWREEMTGTMRTLVVTSDKIAGDTAAQNKTLEEQNKVLNGQTQTLNSIDAAIRGNYGDDKPGILARIAAQEKTEAWRATLFWTIVSALSLAGATALIGGVVYFIRHSK